ncbi:hypothetical protein SNE34_14785, partial [Lysobacter erysipheiresistens]
TQVGLTQALGAVWFLGLATSRKLDCCATSASFWWRRARSGFVSCRCSASGVRRLAGSPAWLQALASANTGWLFHEARTAMVGLRTKSFGVALWLDFSRPV